MKLHRASCSVGRSLHVRCSVGMVSEKLPSTTAQFMNRSAWNPRSVLINAGLNMSLEGPVPGIQMCTFRR